MEVAERPAAVCFFVQAAASRAARLGGWTALNDCRSGGRGSGSYGGGDGGRAGASSSGGDKANQWCGGHWQQGRYGAGWRGNCP